MMVIFDLGWKNLFPNTQHHNADMKRRAKRDAKHWQEWQSGTEFSHQTMRLKQKWRMMKTQNRNEKNSARVYTFHFLCWNKGAFVQINISNLVFDMNEDVNVTSFVNHKFKSLNRFTGIWFIWFIFFVFFVLVFRFGCESW